MTPGDRGRNGRRVGGHVQVLLEAFAGAVFLIVALAKIIETDVYPAGDYRATLVFKAAIALVGVSIGLFLLIHAIATELRRRAERGRSRKP